MKKYNLFKGKTALPPQYKSFTLNPGDEFGPITEIKSEKDDAVRFDLSFASPDPDMRPVFTENGVKYYYDAIRCDETMNLKLLNDHGPFLVNHENSPEATIGVVEKAYIQDGKARAQVRMSKGELGQKYTGLIQEGILSRVSVQYHVDVATERKALAADGNPIFDTSITPVEISLVSIPRDHNVGIGKGAGDDDLHPFNVKYAERKAQEEPSSEVKTETESKATEVEASEVNELNSKVSVTDNNLHKGDNMTDTVKDESVSAVEALQKKNAELMSVGEMYSKYGGQELAYKYVQEGGTVAALNEELLTKMKTELESKADSVESRTGSKEIGLTKKQAEEFSFVRAGMAHYHHKDLDIQKKAAFELDVMKSTDGSSGWGLPAEVFDSPYNPFPNMGLSMKNMRSKALSITDATVGQGGNEDVANLRGVTNLVESFVERLFGANIFMDLVTPAPGNVNSLQWAVQTAGLTINVVDELTASPGPRGDVTIDKRTLDFKRLAAYGTLSSAARIMSAPAAEMILRNDIIRSMNAAITKRFSDMLYQTSDVVLQSVNGTAPTGAGAADKGYTVDWKWVRAMLKQVESVDALNENAAMWFMHPDLYYHLAGVQVASGTNGRFILDYEREKTIFGYPVRKSTIMKNDFPRGASGNVLAGAVYGDASEMIFAEWGTPQLVTDDSEHLDRGFFKVGIERFVNQGFLQDKALVKSTQIDATE